MSTESVPVKNVPAKDVVERPIGQPWYLTPLPTLILQKLQGSSLQIKRVTWADVGNALKEKISKMLVPSSSTQPATQQVRIGEFCAPSEGQIFYKKMNPEVHTQPSALAEQIHQIRLRGMQEEGGFHSFHKSLGNPPATGQVIFKKTIGTS